MVSILGILREVTDLLRSEKRVSLRLIQREFGLNDEDLSTIVDELTAVWGEAVVEDGVLIFRDREPSGDLPNMRPDGLGDLPVELLSPGDTEHRDLTVLFCDLVGSTELSTRLDAEDFGEAIRTYHDAVTTVVQSYGGHVANLMGDGLLVLFGYPTAHDDSARQAVGAALAAVEAIAERELGFDVRIGVHVGPVVVSNIGPGGRSGALALGETVNVAARVEHAAEPGGVYVTDDLARLLDGWFEFESAGAQHFKGLARPIEIHRVVGSTGARSAIEARVGRGLSSLSGRDAELATIRRAWASAGAGAGQLIALIGEPGIGKSRLVEEVRREIGVDGIDWYAGTCSPYATATALHPFAEVPELEVIASAASPAGLSAEGHRKWMLDSILDRIVRRTTEQPLVLLVEDLHWADPTSIELLNLLRAQIDDAPVLVLLTSREPPPAHWVAENVVWLRLGMLDDAEGSELVASLPGASDLTPQAVEAILERAGGNPLYLEELTHTLVENKDETDALVIPPALQTPLLARLDGLGDAKAIAQIASVFGNHFAASSLHRVLDDDRREGMRAALDLMVAKGLILVDPLDANRCSFRHALIHDAAYHSLLKKRRRHIHGRIFDLWHARAESDRELPVAVVARHATAGERYPEAVDLYALAGQQAAGRSAHAEAAQHFRSALEVLGDLSGDTARQELDLQRSLASTFVALLGYTHPETIATWQRTRELATTLADPSEITSSLLGLAIVQYGSGDLAAAAELIDAAMEGAEQNGDDAQLVVAFAERTVTGYFGGDFASALRDGDSAISVYDPLEHHRRIVELVGDDSGVAATSTSAWALMQLGQLDEAVDRGRAAVSLAQSIEHPFSIAQSRLWMMLMLLDLDHVGIAEVEALIAFCDEQGFRLWGGASRIVAAAILGDTALHIEGRDLASSTASLVMVPAILGIEADTRRLGGDLDGALRAVDEGLALSAALKLPFNDARLLWQRAALLASGAGPGPAAAGEIESLLRRSLTVCDQQSSHWYALSAATLLAKHLVEQGRATEARLVLEARCNHIVGGDEIPAVIHAKAMLASLHHEKAESPI